MLTDEQILEIEPEMQSVEVGTAAPASLPAALDNADVNENRPDQSRGAAKQPPQQHAENGTEKTAQAGVPLRDEPVLPEPPAWLAAQMKDPWTGEDARTLWEGTQRAEREAAAFREVFAKPEEAKTAAERARTLDDIDRAYFAGDAIQRAQLAAMMMREDPAAFREMVFEGLRALEAAGASGNHRSVADAIARMRAPGSADESRSEAGHLQDPVGSAGAANTVAAAHANNRALNAHDSAQQAQLAAYAAFERSANEDLERSVGSAIDRTLTQALPALASTRGTSGPLAQHAAPLQGRLAAAIRQDVEKALQGDRQLSEQVAQVLSGRRFDHESRAQVVRLINERALQLVPGAAKRALKDWTQTTLAAHGTKTGRAEFSPGAEVAASSGSSANRSAAAANASPAGREAKQRETSSRATAKSPRVDYRKLSDEQILEL